MAVEIYSFFVNLPGEKYTSDSHQQKDLLFCILPLYLLFFQSALSPYLTGMRQPETSSRIVRDYYATKINDINKTFMLQSHWIDIYATNSRISV